MSFVNTWGYTTSMEHVLAGDEAKYDIGATVKCLSEDGNTLICQYDKKTVHISQSGWIIRQAPEFIWGDKVKIVAKNIIATIELICWHFNDRKYFYHLIDENGKKLSKRYYSDELEKVV